jgi:hypothetical protein
MATSTFFKTIVIGKEAAEIMARELNKPRKPYVPKPDTMADLKRGRELLKLRESRLKTLSEPDLNRTSESQ